MTRLVITVEESRSTREFLISKEKNGRVIIARHSCGLDPANAAAMAVRSAMQHVGQYIIIAHSDVAKHIPKDMMTGRMN